MNPGVYRCLNAATARTLKNCPVNYAFKMVVDIGADYLNQKIIVGNAVKFSPFIRTYDSGGKKWNSWLSTVTSADLGTGVHEFGEASNGALFTLSNGTYCGLLFLIHDNQEQYAGLYLILYSIIIPIKNSNWMSEHTISNGKFNIPKPSNGNGRIRLLDISGSSTYTAI